MTEGLWSRGDDPSVKHESASVRHQSDDANKDSDVTMLCLLKGFSCFPPFSEIKLLREPVEGVQEVCVELPVVLHVVSRLDGG